MRILSVYIMMILYAFIYTTHTIILTISSEVFFFLFFPPITVCDKLRLSAFEIKYPQWRAMVLVYRQKHFSFTRSEKKNRNSSCCSLLQIQSLTQSLIFFQFFRHENSFTPVRWFFFFFFFFPNSLVFRIFFFWQCNATFWRSICGTNRQPQFDVELNQVPSDVFDVPSRRSLTECTFQ